MKSVGISAYCVSFGCKFQLHTSVYAPSFAALLPCLERTETEALARRFRQRAEGIENSPAAGRACAKRSSATAVSLSQRLSKRRLCQRFAAPASERMRGPSHSESQTTDQVLQDGLKMGSDGVHVASGIFGEQTLAFVFPFRSEQITPRPARNLRPRRPAAASIRCPPRSSRSRRCWPCRSPRYSRSPRPCA